MPKDWSDFAVRPTGMYYNACGICGIDGEAPTVIMYYSEDVNKHHDLDHVRICKHCLQKALDALSLVS